jgi:mannose-6-phosphate isomerase-like protein (cupin superfamily)
MNEHAHKQEHREEHYIFEPGAGVASLAKAIGSQQCDLRSGGLLCL